MPIALPDSSIPTTADAWSVAAYGRVEDLTLVMLPVEPPPVGELLVHVEAAERNPLDLKFIGGAISSPVSVQRATGGCTPSVRRPPPRPSFVAASTTRAISQFARGRAHGSMNQIVTGDGRTAVTTSYLIQRSLGS